MNKELLKTGVQEFINKNIDADIMSVLLKKPIFPSVSNKELVQQIQSKKKCRKKLPTWFAAQYIYYPKTINIEQTSSEITARYKSEIVVGKSLCDLSGGLGVDSYFFAKKFDTVFHCEIDSELAQIASHNFDVLGVSNIETFLTNGLDFIKTQNRTYDWLYIDPSRRNELKGKVVKLEDCFPDVPSNLESLFEKSNQVLLKTAPLLDLQAGITSLKFVKEIHIVALENEVKELLWVMEKGFVNEPLIKTVNLGKTGREIFSFLLSEEKTAFAPYSKPLSYLYEPNAALMKSGAFKLIAKRFDLSKLHQHTHLYTSNTLMDFLGRRFKVEECIPYNTRSIKKSGLKKANITTRNFPESVDRIKKKHKIKDGGQAYLFFCKIADENLVLLKCSKI